MHSTVQLSTVPVGRRRRRRRRAYVKFQMANTLTLRGVRSAPIGMGSRVSKFSALDRMDGDAARASLSASLAGRCSVEGGVIDDV